MKKLFIVAMLLITGCKTVHVHVYALPGSGDVDVEVAIRGSDVETDARLK